MGSLSRQLKRGLVKVYSGAGPACLSSLLVFRVEETVGGRSDEAGGSNLGSETLHAGNFNFESEKSSHCNNLRRCESRSGTEGHSVGRLYPPTRFPAGSRSNRSQELGRIWGEGLHLFQHAPSRRNASPVALSQGARFMSAVVTEDNRIGDDEEDKAIVKDVEGDDSPTTELETDKDSLYTSAEGPVHFTSADINHFYTLGQLDVDTYFGEGLPPALIKEFEESRERSFLIRGRVLELFDRFKRCQADTVKSVESEGRVRSPASKHKLQCLLDGFVKSGKSAALAMLVHWARMQGWLVFYVPSGRDWISGGMYYKNEQTGLYDTPVQAKTALEGFLKSHGTLLGTILCRVLRPLQLGEGAGVGKIRGSQEMSLPDGASLKDLVEKGVAVSQAAVSVVLRIREELSLIEEVPVLICIDEFNSWFTFSHFHESTGTRSRRPIHAREMSMVNAFRTMEGPLMMATAFSQSLAVGKLPIQLPGVPKNVRFPIGRYNLEEATAAMNYYHSRKITSKEPSSEDIRKLFYLTNGNGEEMRTLARLLG